MVLAAPDLSLPVTGTRVFPNLTFTQPICLIQARPEDGRWFLAQRDGLVFSFPNDNDTLDKVQVLDISLLIANANGGNSQQWGITCIALHPNFPVIPDLFVAYVPDLSNFFGLGVAQCRV